MKYMFTARWCGNCDVMKPLVSSLKGVEIIDVEEEPEYVEKFTLMSLPTYIVEIEDGFEALTGIKDKKTLEEFYGQS